MAIHATIDLETLDTKPTATILTVGGVKFNPTTAAEPHSEMYYKIDIDEQDALGRTASDSTIEWWGKQDPEIQEEAFSNEDRVSTVEFLKGLSKWAVGVDVFWGQGYGFDYTILEDMYRTAGLPIPWNFWQIRDSRTLFTCMPRDPRKDIQQSLHNALADAYYQTIAIQKTYAALGIKR